MREKKQKPLKCYYVILSRNFNKTHTRAGQPTFFVEKICKALNIDPPTPTGGWDAWETRELLKANPKLHTIRLNYDLWEKRFEEIAAGKAYLSLRYWLDDPYKSPQEEFARLTAADGIGIEPFTPQVAATDDWLEDYAKNDGLRLTDFKDWFGAFEPNKKYAILHFTSFRYNKI